MKFNVFAQVMIGVVVLVSCVPAPAADSKIQIHWFIGLGTGTSAKQVAIEDEVVRDFNNSQNKIELVLDVTPNNMAYDVLGTRISSGNGPDIVGPVGWGITNAYGGQWLDLAPYIQKTGFNLSAFDPLLLKYFQTGAGQVSLPFAVYPAAIYYNPAMFDEAGLAYPPQKYGEKYRLPDGSEVDWNWDTFTQIARLLTIDINGRNSTEPGFDRTHITQFGYSPMWQNLNAVAAYKTGTTRIYKGDVTGGYRSTMPDNWKAAFKWYYDGMWGAQPFMADGAYNDMIEYGYGNGFNAGKAAMTLNRSWYVCCLGDMARTAKGFQLGIQPMGADGLVHGHIETDTFHIWKGTQHPVETFQVLAYLITKGGEKLLPVYGAMSALSPQSNYFLAQKSRDFPFVSQASWNVLVQGLSSPDSASAEQPQPNWIEAYTREQSFLDRMIHTSPDTFNFDQEFQQLKDDLTIIYNK
jgi:multiple sugar transport system substrate-binding protein